MSNEATKWNGIKQMLSHFGVSPSETVYFGDDNDDIEPMVRFILGSKYSLPTDCRSSRNSQSCKG